MRNWKPPRLPLPPAGRENKWLMRLGHRLPYAYGAAAVAQLIWDAAGQPGGTAKVTPNVLWYFALACILAEILQHGRRLCERCAADTPLDPQAAVTRWSRLLRLVHVNNFFLIWMALVAVQVLFDETGSPGGGRYAGDAAATAALGVLVLAAFQHNRLQAWCPWCHWGEDGEHEEVPDPDPAVSL